MQIELNETTEQLLAAQAAAQGRPIHEYAANLLSRYAEASAHPLALSRQFDIKTHEDALAWILSRNPNLPLNAPEETDWQQLKSEGRRYYMSLVLDSSMALTWCLPGQASPLSIAVLKRVQLGGALVPTIWHMEMANILGLKVRDSVLSQREVNDALDLLRLLNITTGEGTDHLMVDRLLTLMGTYRLAAYDAVYMDLALRNHLPLATFDKEMIEAARQNNVTLAGML